MEQLVVLIILVVVGYTAGTIAEKRHYRSIEERERQTIHLPAVTFKKVPVDRETIMKVEMVTGSAVIAVDYFKRLLAGFRNIIGGNVKSYESLLDRARREALLRMKEQAAGASMIINVRIETATIGRGGRKRNVACVEVMAYGTALTIEKT